jgi:hypothetical protein
MKISNRLNYLNHHEETMVFDLTDETHLLQFFMCIVIANFGILTNVFNIIVSSRSKIQEIVVLGFYNICMSCLNILALVFIGYLFLLSQSIGSVELISTSIYPCLFVPFFSRVFSTTTSWVNVLVSYDRICAFKVNYTTHFLSNRKHLKIMIFVIFLLSCLTQVFNLFFYLESQTQYDSARNVTQTITVCTAPKIIQSLRDIFAALARIILPIILQTIFNCVLIVRLFKFRKNYDPELVKEKRLAFTVITFNVIYILGEVPLIVSSVFINIYGYNQTSYISTSSKKSAIASFAYVCSIAFVMLTSHSLLPFLNYLTNIKYRNETKKILRQKIKVNIKRSSVVFVFRNSRNFKNDPLPNDLKQMPHNSM